MSYLVLARKWRPQFFRDLIGQEHVSLTLKNAIDSGRVAHAFLFTGARGVGKTSSARILAKALNCEQGPAPEPCNVCPACEEITAGTSVDVFEIDGASNTGVDDIRELRDNVKYLPSRSRYKIFIIDEVHMLSTSAFNALLKTLEEPPAHVKFIFATTEPHKVPVTILSRCQRFDFKRITLTAIVERLRHIVDQEKITISDTALAQVARKGDGSMRDSLSTLDQVLAFCGSQVSDDEVTGLLGVVDRRLILEVSRATLDRDSRAVLEIVAKVDEFGYNMRQFCQELIDHYRSLLLFKAVDSAAELVDLSEAETREVGERAAGFQLSDLQRCLTILLKADADMAHSSFPRLVLEMALLKMATLAPVIPVNDLLERLKALEARPSGPVVASAEPTWERSAPPRPQPSPSRPSPTPAPDRQPEPPPPARTQSAPAPPAPALAAGEKSWPGFVGFVKEKKPMFATILEKGSPLAVGSGMLQLGFAKGSFELSRLQDGESLALLKELALTYFAQETAIKLVPLSEAQQDAPPSLAEKKSREAANKRQELRELAEGHPLVKAALETFGGTIEELRET